MSNSATNKPAVKIELNAAVMRDLNKFTKGVSNRIESFFKSRDKAEGTMIENCSKQCFDLINAMPDMTIEHAIHIKKSFEAMKIKPAELTTLGAIMDDDKFKELKSRNDYKAKCMGKIASVTANFTVANESQKAMIKEVVEKLDYRHVNPMLFQNGLKLSLYKKLDKAGYKVTGMSEERAMIPCNLMNREYPALALAFNSTQVKDAFISKNETMLLEQASELPTELKKIATAKITNVLVKLEQLKSGDIEPESDKPESDKPASDKPESNVTPTANQLQFDKMPALITGLQSKILTLQNGGVLSVTELNAAGLALETLLKYFTQK